MLKKKIENGRSRTNISLGYPKGETDIQRMSNRTEKCRYIYIEKILEKKENSERKYIIIITLKETLSDSLGRKEKKKEKGLMIGEIGGARGVMVIVLGNRHGDTSSNPGRD